MNDKLDIEDSAALRQWLYETGHVPRERQFSIRNLAGGVSNRTVLVEFQDGGGWVLKQALAKLRVAVDWFSDPVRIEREALGMRWLAKLAPPGTITELVFEHPELHILAMEAVPQPHENLKVWFLSGRTTAEFARQFGELLGTIHRESWGQREQLAVLFEDRSFFETLRVEPYYQYTAQQVPEAARFITALVDECRSRRLTLVHGDYSPKNVLIRFIGAGPGKLVLLDHEVIHFGDPAFDLGFSFAHLLSKAHHCSSSRQEFAELARIYWDSYRAALGETPWRQEIEGAAGRHTLGCLLARVRGRSTLEYLSEEERKRQSATALKLMAAPPSSVPDVIEAFVKGL